MNRIGIVTAIFPLLLTLWGSTSAWPQTVYLDNGILRVGVDLDRGGAISYLSESGSSSSVINIFDLGRYVQQSYYSGPDPFTPPGSTQHPAYAGWGWNPVQAGDAYGNPSLVVEESADGTTIYSKCVPKQWALNNVDSACTMETWIILEENRVLVRCRLNNMRSDTTRYAPRHQELPAVYTVGSLYRLYTYTGSDPYTGDGLTEISNSGPPWEYWNSTEGWSAHVDNANWGLGIYHPGATLTVGGFHGAPGTGNPLSVNTGYIAPLHTDLLDSGIVYDYEYTLILGDLYDDIRSYAYANAPVPGPMFVYGEDRQHCYPVNLKDETPPYDGAWRLMLDQGDPQIVCPPGLWNAADVPVIHIRAVHHTQGDQAEVFFAGEDGLFSGDKRLSIPIIPDGQSHDYEVDLASHPLYSGIITRLRFDPVIGQAPGDSVALQSITAVSPTPVPDVVETRPRIRMLVQGFRSAGRHEVSWKGRDEQGRRLNSGIYIYRLAVESQVYSRKLLLVE